MGKVIKLDQRVEIIAQDVEELKNSGGGGGGGTSDAYTKAEADAKFETITNATATYQKISGMSSYGTKTWTTENFQPIGDYLTATDIADMATKTWVGQQGYLTDANEVPAITSSDNGKVLTASYSGGTGSYAWATPAAGGGLSVETDGTNYWITVNGVRLYFASSAPTGTIPDGSIGVGW